MYFLNLGVEGLIENKVDCIGVCDETLGFQLKV